MRQIDAKTTKAIDGLKQDLRALAALGIDESDPLLFYHHLRELYTDAQQIGISVDWISFRSAYEAERGAAQNKPAPAGSATQLDHAATDGETETSAETGAETSGETPEPAPASRTKGRKAKTDDAAGGE